MSEGARWFLKQSVSLTEGLSVKENTWMNLPMTGGWLGRRGGGGDRGGSAQWRLKRPVRAETGREW